VTDVRFTPLPDSSDERGASYSLLADVLDAMPGVRDVHIASVRPGAIRGNHYHSVRTEVITVVYVDRWSFSWDTGEGTDVRRRQFDGAGAVAVNVPRHWSHAVRNEGTRDLWVFNLSDTAFAPGSERTADAYRREVVR
jgi:oxalate decarboxylase/phosphoglucose isomerase-like protein (cupin superfamily)